MSTAKDRMKLTRKTLRITFDNQWKRQVTKYYLGIFSLHLNREYLPVITKVTKKYIYQNNGCRYRLTLVIMGYGIDLWWHSHHPKQERIKL